MLLLEWAVMIHVRWRGWSSRAVIMGINNNWFSYRWCIGGNTCLKTNKQKKKTQQENNGKRNTERRMKCKKKTEKQTRKRKEKKRK